MTSSTIYAATLEDGLKPQDPISSRHQKLDRFAKPDPKRFDLWAEGSYGEFDTDIGDGQFGIVHVGADYLITPDLLVGLNTQFDCVKLDSDHHNSQIEGQGFLAGTYLTARIAGDFYIDAHAGWGLSENDIEPFGTYEDSFDTERWLASVALIGSFQTGPLTVQPEARLSWFKEESDDYTDSLGVDIPSVSVETGTLSFGPTISGQFELNDQSIIKPFLSTKGIWTFELERDFQSDSELAEEGVRARVEFGFDISPAVANSFGFSLSGYLDGLGDNDNKIWGGKARVHRSF